MVRTTPSDGQAHLLPAVVRPVTFSYICRVTQGELPPDVLGLSAVRKYKLPVSTVQASEPARKSKYDERGLRLNCMITWDALRI